jgi:hypothetical protein
MGEELKPVVAFLSARLEPFWHTRSGCALSAFSAAVVTYLGLVCFHTDGFGSPEAIVPSILPPVLIVAVWFRHPPHGANVPVQSEEFINIIISEEPDKLYLRFCTGLINYNAKRDFASAKADFEQFLGIEDIDSFPWARDLTLRLLPYCERYS